MLMGLPLKGGEISKSYAVFSPPPGRGVLRQLTEDREGLNNIPEFI